MGMTVDMDQPDEVDGLPSDDEEDLSQAGAAELSKQKRRVQKAIFDQWITSPVGQDALKPKTRDGSLRSAIDEQQSIHSLLAEQQNATQIVRNPREYQMELFERAKSENTIAVLDTGSGKTLIAVLLLRWVIDQELERRAAGHLPKISFFVVASVTLVYQQHAVLECNLDHDIARYSGADGVDRWNKTSWEEAFHKHKVIVCTAEILRQCLSRSYITLKQINLLIFDEAHHTKKDHPFARIIKDSYLTEPDPAARPRVFGMTASPIDARTDVVQAAMELEGLLNCRIATTSDMSFTEAVKKPQEEVLWYASLPFAGFETALFRDLSNRYNAIDVFTSVFTRASQIARELGHWCADHFLLNSLSYEKQASFELQVQRIYRARHHVDDVAQLDAAIQQIRDAIEYAQSHAAILSDTIGPADVSSKVSELCKYLRMQFERESTARCIVFVERRLTAQILRELFRRIGTQHMRGDFLVGNNSSSGDEISSSLRQQVITLLKFRKGEVNCLFATSVAEEGLDVPDCNLVIRFDIYKTMIQYVQSRGRARKQNSKFIHMAERNNSVHTQVMSEVRYQELAMREFCNALPEDRRLCGNEDVLEQIMEKEKNLRTYTETSTGAKLTYGNALVILAHFISAMPTEDHEPQHPTYVVSNLGPKFIGEVMLPAHAPICTAVGRTCTKKALAKRSAAFEACLELRKMGLLNEYLMPVYQKKLPAMRNALLAVDDKARIQYVVRSKPTIWKEERKSRTDDLWAVVVSFDDNSDEQYRPLVLLTRSSMPQFPEFPIYLHNDDATVVRCTSIAEPLKVAHETLRMLTGFTMRVFRDIFSKTYQDDTAMMSYWLGPASLGALTMGLSPDHVLDLQLLKEVFANNEYEWTPQMPNRDLLNRFLVDKWDGSRKFYSQGINAELKQTDAPPDDVVKGKYMSSILDYSVSLFKSSRAKAVWKSDQPVIEAFKVNVTRRNMLAPLAEKERVLRTKAYLVPEPLRISVLPPAVARTCFAWPAIIHRLEAFLISIEGCKFVGVDCSPALALAAFTKDSDNSGEHNETNVNFRQGMGENYERLEFIGDTFLKMATTISTFIMNPNENEFEFHVRRMLMLCNNNLFNVACNLKLYEYVRTTAFSRRLWYPEGLVLLEGTGVKKGENLVEQYHSEQTHALSDKTIADVCEAIIGAAYLAHDKPGEWKPEQWNNAVAAVTKLVGSTDHTMAKWDDYQAAYHIPAYQTGDITARHRHLAEQVCTKHAYEFQYPRLLYSAFLHPSVPFIHEQAPNYQRLEFLGDALLDMVSITYLFHRYPDKDPQWLTEHKMAMVSNKFLGALCVTIGFHVHLRYQHSQLQHQIQEYTTELLEAKQSAGKDCRDFWTTVSDPPKCLPDVVESYVGAVFIDSGFDYNQVQRFFDTHMKWYFEDMSIYDTFANSHPCTHLYNLLQTTFGCSDFRLMAREVPAVDGGVDALVIVAVVLIHDRIVAHSAGKSGRYARIRVAQRAVEQLDGLPPMQFRATYGCQCGQKSLEARDGQIGGHAAAEFGMGIDCSI